MKFAQQFKKLRKDKNLTPDQLADSLNLDKNLIINWEKGISEPSTKQLVAIAQFFQVTTDYLLGLEKESSTNFLTPFIDLSNEKEKELDDELLEELIELNKYIDLKRKK